MSTNPSTTPPADSIARLRHPTGAPVRRALVTLAAAGLISGGAAVVAPAASAHPHPEPHAHSVAEAQLQQEARAASESCGPGFYPREQYGYCKARVRLSDGSEVNENDNVGEWALAVIAAAALFALA